MPDTGLIFWISMLAVLAGWAVGEYALSRLPIPWNAGVLGALAVVLLMLPTDSSARTVLFGSSMSIGAVLLSRVAFSKLSPQQRYKSLLIAVPAAVAWVLWRRSQWP